MEAPPPTGASGAISLAANGFSGCIGLVSFSASNPACTFLFFPPFAGAAAITAPLIAGALPSVAPPPAALGGAQVPHYDIPSSAERLMPGGVNSPVRAFRGVGGNPLFIERGEGSYMYDADGNRFIDYVLSWGPLILGHAEASVVEKI